MNNSEKTEKVLLWTSFVVASLIAIAEILIAIRTGSQAVLFDAMYDSSELIVVVFTLFLTPLFYKPISEKHPFGFGQIESFVILIKAFMLLSVTVGLSVQTIEKLFSGGNIIDKSEVSLFQLSLGFIAIIVFITLSRLNRNISSPTARAEILGWKMDIFSGFGMSLAFYVATILEKTSLYYLAPYFDPIITLSIVFLMVPNFIKMIIITIKDVFLFSPEEEIFDYIKTIADTVLTEYNFTLVFCDVTRTGRHLWISIYFNEKQGLIKVADLNAAQEEIDAKLSKKFDDFDVELVVEPKGLFENSN